MREPADLEGVSGLILPGGESTTMRQLIERWGLREPILDLAERGAPIFGTCAGMIVLAAEIAGGEPPILPLLDVTVERNAFGRQLDSFEAELPVPILGDTPVHAVFIRAPIIERTGPASTSWPGSTTAGSSRSASATSSPPRSTRSSPARRASTGSWRRWPPSTTTRARAPAAGPTRPDGRDGMHDEAPPMTEARAPRSPGKVRAARLTDLAALGELSRLCQSDGADTRSLGLPVSGPPIGVFSLFRLPLGAFQPNDLMYVYEEDGPPRRPRPRGARHRPRRVDDRGARCGRDGRCRRHPLPARPAAAARGRKRAAARFHVACADADGNVELFMQAGFIRYGEERILVRPPASPCPDRGPTSGPPPPASARPAVDALALSRLYAAATPPRSPGSRPSACRLGAQGTHWRVPRSSLDADPALRRRRGVRPGRARRRQGRDRARRASSRSASPRRISRTTSRSRPAGRGRPALVDFGLGVIAGAGRQGRRPPPRPRRVRSRANLRITDRPPTGGGRLRLDRERHAAHEGNPRPRRRTGPRAGRRPLTPLVEASVASDDRRRESIDDLDALLGALPPGDRGRGPCAARSDRALIEVVMDLGRRPEARFPDSEVMLLEREIAEADIAYVVEHIGSFGDDNRAGIERTLHRISAIRNRNGKIVGLTCRIGRAVFGTIEIINDFVETGKSILIMGRPGIGKTTMLREAARVLADDMGKRVVVVDTSNEIAGDGDIPHPAIGKARRMQVRTPSIQHEVMIEAVENHMPQVIVIDEIGTELEAQAARTIAERGVQLIGTAHGNNLDNLMLNPTLSDLIGGIQSVTLGDEEARRRRTQKSVLERKAPPTFDVIVEIQDRERVVVHGDVAETVDAMLRGDPVAPELRWRDEEGVHRSQGRPRPSPREQLGASGSPASSGPGRPGAWSRAGAARARTGPAATARRTRGRAAARLPAGRVRWLAPDPRRVGARAGAARPRLGGWPGRHDARRAVRRAVRSRRPARPRRRSSPARSPTAARWSAAPRRPPPRPGPATRASSSARRRGATRPAARAQRAEGGGRHRPGQRRRARGRRVDRCRSAPRKVRMARPSSSPAARRCRRSGSCPRASAASASSRPSATCSSPS